MPEGRQFTVGRTPDQLKKQNQGAWQKLVSGTEGGIIEARVSHRKSSQQHTQAGPKKYTKIANELKNNRAPPSAAPHRGRRFAPPPVVLFFNSFAIFVYFVGPSLCMLLTTFPLGVA